VMPSPCSKSGRSLLVCIFCPVSFISSYLPVLASELLSAYQSASPPLSADVCLLVCLPASYYRVSLSSPISCCLPDSLNVLVCLPANLLLCLPVLASQLLSAFPAYQLAAAYLSSTLFACLYVILSDSPLFHAVTYL
jgi:hypothetical protein